VIYTTILIWSKTALEFQYRAESFPLDPVRGNFNPREIFKLLETAGVFSFKPELIRVQARTLAGISDVDVYLMLYPKASTFLSTEPRYGKTVYEALQESLNSGWVGGT